MSRHSNKGEHVVIGKVSLGQGVGVEVVEKVRCLNLK